MGLSEKFNIVSSLAFSVINAHRFGKSRRGI